MVKQRDDHQLPGRMDTQEPPGNAKLAVSKQTNLCPDIGNRTIVAGVLTDPVYMVHN